MVIVMFNFNPNTPVQVQNVLTNAFKTGKRIRLFYGDHTTGYDWKEENDVIGTIGMSTGSAKVPLLIKNRTSMSGGAILDHCIIKIVETEFKTVLYQSENYQKPILCASSSTHSDYMYDVYSKDKIGNNSLVARFKSEKSKDNWIQFMLGYRMAK